MEEAANEVSSLSPEKEEENNTQNNKIWCLKRVGKDSGWLRLFDNTEVTIGRGLNVTYQILSGSFPLMISRNHCMFKQKEGGQWTVTDNESLNGVWVNGTRISPGKPHALQQGDVVQLGVPLDGNPVEFEYILLHSSLDKIKDFLTKAAASDVKSLTSRPKKPKRKFGTDETELCNPSDSKSKLYRTSNTDISHGQVCPTAAVPDQAGPSQESGNLTQCSDSSQHLTTLKRYSNNLKALKECMGATQKRAAELERQQSSSLEQQQEMQVLREQMKLLQGELKSQQELAQQRMAILERSVCEEGKLLAHRRIIEELKYEREGFQEVLQAKDKELEVTKEEKERARAQKDEVVTQMTEVLENELQCIICAELFIEAVTLSCAHSFCQHCIADWRRRKDECPICRQPIVSQARSLVLDNCIDRMVENLSTAMRERRTVLISQRKDKPIVEELLPKHQAFVLEKLPSSLPLTITANLISDEGYWKRCCQSRWRVCDTSEYGDSWKRMFFERYLENIIEHFVPDVTDIKSVLETVPLCKDYVKRLRISQLLPPVKEPLMFEESDSADSVSDFYTEGSSMDHFDFRILLDKLSNLEELQLVYGVKNCGMNFEWQLFQFTLRDCESLAEAVKSCKTLKVLRIHRSNMDDGKCRMLVNHLMDHPSLLELDFSHNIIGDRGARAIGKLLNHSCLQTLNIYNNRISGQGAQALAHALSKNTSLQSLNLRLNQIGDVGGQAIAQALLKNKTLVNLQLEANEMTEPTATALSQVLIENTTLRNLNLSCNKLGTDGGKVLEEAMSHNSSLLELDIRLTEMNLESQYHIREILCTNQDKARRKHTQDTTNTV
ncbi:E3 ubiquitin-protein ligase rnf8 [Bagarius yarrelli]|uniref:E3 ubiquitin-protein ligase CHFR n=1 Tax=Bagarius yarrelli TaxID=175774 RepID=A0A556TT57_BAGYA|nr:E3 ubiquitin-protein ligase rnf8 [Bagarius yarrelli]